MDDFSREFCNWEKLREQRNKIKTEIDNIIKNLNIKDLDNYMEIKTKLEYVNYLGSIRDYFDKYDKEFESKDVKKLISLIDIYDYLDEIEYTLTQIRLNNIYIKNH